MTLFAVVCCPVCGDIWTVARRDHLLGERSKHLKAPQICSRRDYTPRRDDHPEDHDHDPTQSYIVDFADRPLPELSDERQAHFHALAKLFHNVGE